MGKLKQHEDTVGRATSRSGLKSVDLEMIGLIKRFNEMLCQITLQMKSYV